MKKALLLFAALLVAGCGGKGEKSLSDSKVKKPLIKAVDFDSLEERGYPDVLYYQANRVTNLTALQRPAEEPAMEDRNPEGRPDV